MASLGCISSSFLIKACMSPFMIFNNFMVHYAVVKLPEAAPDGTSLCRKVQNEKACKHAVRSFNPSKDFTTKKRRTRREENQPLTKARRRQKSIATTDKHRCTRMKFKDFIKGAEPSRL